MSGEHAPGTADLIVGLRPLRPEDAAAHHAGEDALTVRFLSRIPSTLDQTRAWIARTLEEHAAGAPRRTFGMFLVDGGALAGMVELNRQASGLARAEVNVSYSVHPAQRGRGLAARAVTLALQWAQQAWPAPQQASLAVLRVSADNAASLAVVRKLGCVADGRVRGAAAGDVFERFVRPLHPGLPVFIHGMGGAAGIFDDVVGAVGGRALDLPGHGTRVDAPLDDIGALADDVAARIEDASLVVGHSMGGAIGQVLAARHPAKVARLVLLASALRFPAAPAMLGAFDADGAAFRALFGKALGTPRARAILEGTTDAALRADLAACARYDARELAIACPVVVVAGAGDEITPEKATARLAEVRKARLVALGAGGHMLPETAPDDVAQVVRANLRA